MSVDLVALKNELLTDPASLGYATFVANRNDTQLADILNFARDGSTPCPVNNVVGSAITIRRQDISSQSVCEAILVADYTALPGNPNASQLSQERRFLSWMEALVNAPTIRLVNDDGTDTPVLTNFQAMFPAGSGTRNRLLALANRAGSRVEQLFGTGVAASVSDVSTALNS